MSPIFVWSHLAKLSPYRLPYVKRNWLLFRKTFLSCLDAICTSFALYLAFIVRLDTIDLTTYDDAMWQLIPLLVVVNLAIFGVFGVNQQVWRRANIRSVWIVVKANFVAVVIFTGVDYFFLSSLNMPRSVPFIYYLISTFLILAQKLIWRAINDYAIAINHGPCKRALIIGAGDQGEVLLNHLKSSKESEFEVIGFIDSNPELLGRSISGAKVLGPPKKLESIVKNKSIDEVIVTNKGQSGKELRQFFRQLPFGVKVSIMPDISGLLRGNSLPDIRPVDIKDLLKRRKQKSDTSKVRRIFSSKVVLVTGAGGSIGSELCRQISSLKPSRLLLIEASEFNLYQLSSELEKNFPSTPIVPLLGTVCSTTFLNQVFSEYRPDIVIHAAAYKHVPLVEKNVCQAVINNVEGTYSLIAASIKFDISRFILVSTDKAVNPTNVMGASKRACELLVQLHDQKSDHNTKLSIVRFGNVLGSSGSVIPKFMEQIRHGEKVTVTHEKVTRFFMLIEEAVSLILESSLAAKGGDIFILDMGSPVSIYDMACDLIKLSGKELGKDIDIEFTGLRPGEKMHEELVLEDTEIMSVLDNMFVAKSEIIDTISTENAINSLIAYAKLSNVEKCREILNELCFGNHNEQNNLMHKGLIKPDSTLVDQI